MQCLGRVVAGRVSDGDGTGGAGLHHVELGVAHVPDRAGCRAVRVAADRGLLERHPGVDVVEALCEAVCLDVSHHGGLAG